MYNKSSISSRIKLAMNKKGVKQKDVIEHTGITKGALSSYLSGRYEPKQDNLFKLANYLEVEPSWLLGFDKDVEIITRKEFISEVILLLSKTSNLTEKEKNKIISEIKYICEDE